MYYGLIQKGGKTVRGTVDWKKWGVEGQERLSEAEDQSVIEI